MSDEDERDGRNQLTKRPDAAIERSDGFENSDGEIQSESGLEVHERHADGVALPSQGIALQRSMSLKLSSHKGPLPSPEQFREYEAICPGAADRIIKMAENEGDHRRNLESQMVKATIATERRSQYLGLLVYLTSLGVGAYLLSAGVPVVGITTILTTLAAMLGGAVWNKVEDRRLRQLEERAQQKALEDQAQKDARRRQESKRRKKNNKGR